MSENEDGPLQSRSIRVRILDRDYPLRVAPGDEDYTMHLARKLDERLLKIRNGLPGQPDLTHAILGALELAEDLYAARAETDRLRAHVEIEMGRMTSRLDDALQGSDSAQSPARPPRAMSSSASRSEAPSSQLDSPHA